MATVLDEAQAAASPTDLVQVERGRLGVLPLFGYVVGVSPACLLLQRFSERLDLDGYEAVRLSDVTQLNRTFPRKAFYLKVVSLRAYRAIAPQGIDLSSMKSLLRSIEQRYPLVVISRERVVPDECEIGRIKLTSETTYALRMITPEATWTNDDQVYRYEDVTRVGFDGAYENTLAQVSDAAV